ncbi:MAG TPA: DUF4149 domain-containing protein [Candidatus Binataceae bacterium]|nr:DUF4149 domain-containing protein [Candidatus Binataceae bacterium]
MTVTLFIYLLSLVCWLGGMVFFSIFTAPVIFRVLARADAGKVVSGIFPRYYLLGYIAGAIALALALYFCFLRSGRLWWMLSAAALAIALGLTIYAGAVLRPRIDAIHIVAEEPSPEAARKLEFDHLHRLSVSLNGGVMVLNLLALLSTAAALSQHYG